LSVGDREALLLQLRRATFGERLEAVLPCPSAGCGERMELTLDVGDLLLPPYRDVRRWHDLTVDIDGAAYALSFRLPTARDIDRAAPIARTDPAEAARELVRCSVRHSERDGTWVDPGALPAAVVTRLGAAMADLDPQAELDLDLRCPACEQRFSMLFDVATFFLCELDGRGARVLEEVHALASHYHWSEREILHMPSSRRAVYLRMLDGTTRRADGAP
jgi:hypothetical protein